MQTIKIVKEAIKDDWKNKEIVKGEHKIIMTFNAKELKSDELTAT